MKMKRMVACVLTLLLVVSILPIGAMATDNDGDMGTNTGSIDTNRGTIGYNGTSEGGRTSGTVNVNCGVIGENYGTVKDNIDLNEAPNVFIGENHGLVESNNAIIYDNKSTGEVITNNGTVKSNSGTIGTNNDTVEENYGTVETNAIDGVVTNCSENRDDNTAELSLDNKDAAPSEKEPVVLEGKVVENFGTVVDKTDPDNPVKYYGLSWGDDIQNLTLIDGKVEAGTKGINLDEIANGIQRKGYKMKSYTAYSREERKDVEIDNIADYEMNAPTWLKILWQKLGGKSEPKPTRTPVYTKLSGDQVKAGAFVSVNGCIFKIIEVNEDNIRVATVNQLPEKALTDMLGFLKQYLSDAQIAKFQSEPELLEEELVAKFFGGSNEHIAFYAARDLFA